MRKTLSPRQFSLTPWLSAARPAMPTNDESRTTVRKRDRPSAARAQPVSPSAPAEQAEQQQMSAYDAEQQKLDEQLDQRLNICRG